MERSGKVSLWLGVFENRDDFFDYINVLYDEDGNSILSKFQTDYEITKYDPDKMESDWIEVRCNSINELLEGFSYDDIIIPQFSEVINSKNIQKYNSIILIYDFEYIKMGSQGKEIEYIGCAELKNT